MFRAWVISLIKGSFVIRKQWLDQAETLAEKKKPSWAGSKMYFPGKWNCKYRVIINVEDSYKIIFVYDKHVCCEMQWRRVRDIYLIRILNFSWLVSNDWKSPSQPKQTWIWPMKKFMWQRHQRSWFPWTSQMKWNKWLHSWCFDIKESMICLFACLEVRKKAKWLWNYSTMDFKTGGCISLIVFL